MVASTRRPSTARSRLVTSSRCTAGPGRQCERRHAGRGTTSLVRCACPPARCTRSERPARLRLLAPERAGQELPSRIETKPPQGGFLVLRVDEVDTELDNPSSQHK